MSNSELLRATGYSLLGIAGIALLILLRGCMGCNTEAPASRAAAPAVAPANVATLIEYRYDTVVRYRDRIVVQRAPARVIAHRDTVVEWRDTSGATSTGTPFTAQLDTIVGRDTVSVTVNHPPPRLSLMLRSAPDSIRVETRTITITQQESAPWWHYVLTSIGSTAVGYGLGRIR